MSKLKPSVKVGDVFKTKTGNCKIVEYNSATDVIVEFLDEHKYQCKVEVGQLKRGNIKNVFYPSVFGVGYLGEGIYNSKEPLYRKWFAAIKSGMITKGDKLCDFQIFVDWCKEGKLDNKWVMNRSLLSNRNGSLEVCKIPLSLHHAMSLSGNVEGGFLLGVFKSNKTATKPYSSKLRKCYKTHFLGIFDTQEEAHKAYVEAKESYVKELAVKYKEELPKEVFDALMNWTVEVFAK